MTPESFRVVTVHRYSWSELFSVTGSLIHSIEGYNARCALKGKIVAFGYSSLHIPNLQCAPPPCTCGCVHSLHFSLSLSETVLSLVASEVMSEYLAIVIWFNRNNNSYSSLVTEHTYIHITINAGSAHTNSIHHCFWKGFSVHIIMRSWMLKWLFTQQ